jgi:hypothetical protein
MNSTKILATCVAAVLVGVSSPALAQRQGGGRDGQNRGSSPNRGAVNRGDSGNRGGSVYRGNSRSQGGSVYRGNSRSQGGSVYRGDPRSQGGSVYRGAVGRSYGVSPRYPPGPRNYAYAHGGYVARRGGAYPYYRYSRVAPVRFYRPYYSFRPRVNLGFGLYVGYPFAYSYPYYYPFYYPSGYVNAYGGYPPYAYGYPAASAPAYPPASNSPPAVLPESQQGSIAAQPAAADTGGLSFEITPSTAQLFVDGALVGTVAQFTPTSQPLGLVAGRHHIEIRASGYRTMSFDVDITAGQVIPYQGSMER